MAVTIIGAVVGTAVAGGISLLSFGPGVGDLLSRTLNETFQQRIALANDLINARRRGDLSESQFRSLMNQNGFNNEQIKILLSSTKANLNVQEILTLWFRYREDGGNRFNVNNQWLKDRFEAIGVDSKKQTEIVEANRPVPNLDDIIRFAVRDVFEPEAVKLGRLDENLPPKFIEEASKRGFEKSDAINVWRAHWIFPSINQAFEMFHRLFDHPNPAVRFGRQEMDTYFNVADIAPGMRERLQAIAFQPIGRVDIRRFARLGIYGEGEDRKPRLIRAYQELGYSPENAANQADFTIRLVDRQSAIFSRAQILKNFRLGLPKENPEEFARKQFKQRGLSETDIDTLLDLEKEKIIKTETQIKIDQIREDFVSGVITSSESLRDRLGKLGLSDGQRRELFEDISSEAKRKLRRPSTSKADEMLQAGIIAEKDWRSIYAFNGFAKKDQDNLLKLVRREQSSVQRLPSKDDLLSFLQNGLLPVEEFRSLMNQLGYAKRFVDLYLQNAGFALEEE